MAQPYVAQDLGGFGRLAEVQLQKKEMEMERQRMALDERRASRQDDLAELQINQAKNNLAMINTKRTLQAKLAQAVASAPKGMEYNAGQDALDELAQNPIYAEHVYALRKELDEDWDEQLERVEKYDPKTALSVYNNTIGKRHGITLEYQGQVEDSWPYRQGTLITSYSKDAKGNTVQKTLLKPKGGGDPIDVTDKYGLLTKPETAKEKEEGKNLESATKLRKEFQDDAKDYVKVRDSYVRVVNSAKDPSAAGDLALIFNYMKILDPGSVVRESEFATASNAAGVPDIVRNTYNRVLSGERLALNQRADFVDRADRLYKGMESQHGQRVEEFTRLAEEYGVKPDLVITKMAPIDKLEPGKPATMVVPFEGMRVEARMADDGNYYVEKNGKFYKYVEEAE